MTSSIFSGLLTIPSPEIAHSTPPASEVVGGIEAGRQQGKRGSRRENERGSEHKLDTINMQEIRQIRLACDRSVTGVCVSAIAKNERGRVSERESERENKTITGDWQSAHNRG